MSNLPITWNPRSTPLPPVGVAAQGAAAQGLANRLLGRTDEQLALLAGVQGDKLLIVLSEDSTLLPWADGVIYLGRDPIAPSLLIPTTHAPSVPLPLLERALRHRFPESTTPLAVLPPGDSVVSLSGCRRPIVRATLQKWMEAQG